MNPMAQWLSVQPPLAEALAAGQAVTALESTIISHGMPYPRNVETALAIEAAVRESGALPATIALLDGKLRVGLGADDIERLGQPGAGVIKASRRDLAALLSRRLPGATTVAATMLIAHWAGIRIFATGGIGGVHRGGALSMDVSADLRELATTPVAVVTAGAKAILDLPLTLEYLETQGVPVLGYGTSDFPAFYSRRSGLKTDYRFDGPLPLAQMLHTHWQLGLGGVVVANPVPEADEIPADKIEAAIAQALAEADAKGIKGKEVTPFLLARMEALTRGESLVSNVALVLNNARLGGELAVALSGLDERRPGA
jgi:pseudouridine-5'-phosphate glycosidase